jgi:hypothetical protein
LRIGEANGPRSCSAGLPATVGFGTMIVRLHCWHWYS